MKQVCVQCGIPTMMIPHYGKVRLDENGMCEFCNHYNQFRDVYQIDYEKNLHVFEEFVEYARGKAEYDCIVLFTGGKDSSYTLYLLKNKYRLKVLALTWDNGFFSESMKRNIDNLVTNLGVEHIYVKTDWNVLKDIYRNRLLNYGRICSCGTLCILFTAPIINKIKAPLVFYSNSYGQMLAQAETTCQLSPPSKYTSRQLKATLHMMGKVPVKNIITVSGK